MSSVERLSSSSPAAVYVLESKYLEPQAVSLVERCITIIVIMAFETANYRYTFSVPIVHVTIAEYIIIL